MYYSGVSELRGGGGEEGHQEILAEEEGNQSESNENLPAEEGNMRIVNQLENGNQFENVDVNSDRVVYSLDKCKISVTSKNTFGREFSKKYIKFSPIIPTIPELLEVMTHETFLNMHQHNFYDRMQVILHINTEKVTDTGEILTSKFYSCTNSFVTADFCDIIKYELDSIEDRIAIEGSSWNVSGIEDIEINYFKTGRVTTKLGSWMQYPFRKGPCYIVNPKPGKTNRSCVELAILAHFFPNGTPSRTTAAKLVKHNRDYNCIQFPKMEGEITFEDLDIIEKRTGINLFIYSVEQLERTDSNKDEHEVKLIRRGKNPSLPITRNIYLLSMYNEECNNYHLAYITHIEKYLALMRGAKLVRGETLYRMCTYCISCV